MIGQTISHYKILELLGEGGIGIIYEFEDTKLKKIVIISFLHFKHNGICSSRIRDHAR